MGKAVEMTIFSIFTGAECEFCMRRICKGGMKTHLAIAKAILGQRFCDSSQKCPGKVNRLEHTTKYTTNYSPRLTIALASTSIGISGNFYSDAAIITKWL